MIAFELSVIELRKNMKRSEKQFIRCIIRYVKLGMRECVRSYTQSPLPSPPRAGRQDGRRLVGRNEEMKNLIIYCY